MAITNVQVPSLGRRLSRLMANPSSALPDTHIAGLDAYHQMGGNCIYLHGEGGETHSREATGQWLRERGRRSEFFLCTQVCHDDWDEANGRSVDRFTAAALKQDVARDLELIGIRQIDLVGLSDKPNAPLEPIMDAISSEIEAGRVGGYGLCNWSADRIRLIIDCAKRASYRAPGAIFTTEFSLLRAIDP